MSHIWNAERKSRAILRPQSWLCDGAWCRCEMQRWVQSDAALAECRVPVWVQCHEQIGQTQDPLFSEIVTKPLPMVILFKWDLWCKVMHNSGGVIGIPGLQNNFWVQVISGESTPLYLYTKCPFVRGEPVTRRETGSTVKFYDETPLLPSTPLWRWSFPIICHDT